MYSYKTLLILKLINVQKINKINEYLAVQSKNWGKRKYYTNSLKSKSEYFFINSLGHFNIK